MPSDSRSEHKHNLSIILQQSDPVTWPGQQSDDVTSCSSHWANLIRPIRERLSGSSGLILPLCLRTQEPRETWAGRSSQGHVRVRVGTDALGELELWQHVCLWGAGFRVTPATAGFLKYLWLLTLPGAQPKSRAITCLSVIRWKHRATRHSNDH